MKNFLFTCALVAGTTFAASAQTPMGTPPSGTVPPSGSTNLPKPDATIETQANTTAPNTNPAERRMNRKRNMRDGSMKKGKNMKMKTKMQTPSTM